MLRALGVDIERLQGLIDNHAVSIIVHRISPGLRQYADDNSPLKTKKALSITRRSFFQAERVGFELTIDVGANNQYPFNHLVVTVQPTTL